MGTLLVIECHPGSGGEDAANFADYLAASFITWAREHGVRACRDDRRAVSVQLDGGGHLYRDLVWLAGHHRRQSVPVARKNARQTSSVHVAVLRPADPGSVPAIPDDEIRVDVFRAQGPGGQGVNTTDSAVRMTHLPTGLVASCQAERSQHQNRVRARAQLAQRLSDHQAAAAAAELHAIRSRQTAPQVLFAHNWMRGEVVHLPTRTRWRERDWAQGRFARHDLRGHTANCLATDLGLVTPGQDPRSAAAPTV
jgi:peptide chain release factor 2